MQFFTGNASVCFCCQLIYQFTGFINRCLLILTYNFFCRINRITCLSKRNRLIFKFKISFLSGYRRKNLSAFSNCDFPLLFLIWDSQALCFPCLQLHIESLRIQLISIGNGYFFEIYRFLCLRNFYLRFSFFICCRHFSNQLGAFFVAVNSKNCTCKIYICHIILFHNLDFCIIHPFYFKTHRIAFFFKECAISNILSRTACRDHKSFPLGSHFSC